MLCWRQLRYAKYYAYSVRFIQVSLYHSATPDISLLVAGANKDLRLNDLVWHDISVGAL